MKHMINSRAVYVVLAVILALMLCACAASFVPQTSVDANQEVPLTGSPDPDTAIDDNPKPDETPVMNKYPRTVTDQAGRIVVIERQPESIVSGYYISSSACIALGLTDNFVGIEARADSRPIYALAAPMLLELPNVGTAKDFNLEACLALSPDIVILPIRLWDAADILTEIDVPVILVNPESYGEIIEMIALIGEATGTDERAERLIEWFAQTCNSISEKNAHALSRPDVYISGVSSWLTTAPSDMYQSSLVDIAGGQNAARNIDGSGWVEISYEQLIAMNPEVIIIPSEAGYSVEDVLADSTISELEAVKNNAVYKMPFEYEAWDSPIPSSMLGAIWLSSVLHQETYPMIDLHQATIDFYSEFYGINT